MRIIPDETGLVFFDGAKNPVVTDEYGYAYRLQDTIEITDAEWDTIGYEWQDDCCVDGLCASHGVTKQYKPFSQYLRDLLELKRCQK